LRGDISSKQQAASSTANSKQHSEYQSVAWSNEAPLADMCIFFLLLHEVD
jgi:hypothetical protein